jgi:hypothetical protein
MTSRSTHWSLPEVAGLLEHFQTKLVAMYKTRVHSVETVGRPNQTHSLKNCGKSGNFCSLDRIGWACGGCRTQNSNERDESPVTTEAQLNSASKACDRRWTAK